MTKATVTIVPEAKRRAERSEGRDNRNCPLCQSGLSPIRFVKTLRSVASHFFELLPLRVIGYRTAEITVISPRLT